MNKTKFEYYMHYRPRHEESIESRHATVTAGMQKLPEPLSWKGLQIPPAPDCGEHLSASYEIKYPISGLWLFGNYTYRGDAYVYHDEASYDDKISIAFSSTNPFLNYKEMLHQQLPAAIAAYAGYLAKGYYASYFVQYENLHQAEIDALEEDPTFDLNGRNNIFTLNVTQYWDEALCQRAMGFGRDEVIKRLSNSVPLVKPLMDGVYVVFNDNPDLTFEEFCAYNDRLKPILGLA